MTTGTPPGSFKTRFSALGLRTSGLIRNGENGGCDGLAMVLVVLVPLHKRNIFSFALGGLQQAFQMLLDQIGFQLAQEF